MKKSFSHSEIKVRITNKGTLLLLHPFSYTNSNGKTFTAHEGFEFDGASIPKFFWRIIDHPFSHRIIKPACIHDLLYKNAEIPKKDADNLFNEMMEVDDKLSSWKQFSVYQAVDKFGQSSWDENRKNDIIQQDKKRQRDG